MLLYQEQQLKVFHQFFHQLERLPHRVLRELYPELTEKNPMLTQITHLAASCTEQQKRMVVRFIRMLQDEEYGD